MFAAGIKLRNPASSALSIPLALAVVFFHFLPLLSGKEVIKASLLTSWLSSKGTDELAMWRLVITYVALDAIEIGLGVLLGGH